MKYKKTATVFAGLVMAMGLASPALADPDGTATTSNSGGLLSGNAVVVPVEADVLACGNTISVIGLLNPAAGNTCVNH
ncbi:chaplin [Streptomyces sp. NPDC000410]|uniref:chaplin n=1 Tax=Streptomyces sp. NPDC000410 TaxID=3154254 RepID=UPI00331BAA41